MERQLVLATFQLCKPNVARTSSSHFNALFLFTALNSLDCFVCGQVALPTASIREGSVALPVEGSTPVCGSLCQDDRTDFEASN